MSNQNPTEQRSMMLQALPMFVSVMQKHPDTFWKAQANSLDGTQDFAKGWFQRRHIGV